MDGLLLNNSGAVSGSNWSVSANGLAHFSKIYGQVANNYTFKGGGITMGGGGSRGSSINPGTVGMAGSSGVGVAGSLGNGLYTAYKAKFDTIYAKRAEFDYLKVFKGINFTGINLGWTPVNSITGIYVAFNGTTKALTVQANYTRRQVLGYTSGSGSWSDYGYIPIPASTPHA